MKKTSLLASLLTLAICGHGLADFQQQFDSVKEQGDPKAIQTYLAESYDREKDNPEYFVAAANYWWGLANEISMTTAPAAAGGISIVDPKTGKEAGSMATVGSQNPGLPKKAAELLKEGSERFPYRIDIALGYASIQKSQGDFDGCLETLRKMISFCERHPQQLRWKNNRPLPQPANRCVPEAVQGYTSYFYETKSKENSQRCRTLCEIVIKAFPDHPYAYNILAAQSQADGDENACIKYLEIAHTKDPNDAIVLLNLGDAYSRAGNFQKARTSYQSVKNSNGSQELKAEAEAAIRSLKKK